MGIEKKNKIGIELLEDLLEEVNEYNFAEKLDEEIINGNWYPEDWEEEYESEYDAYIEISNKEAEDSVIDTFIAGFLEKHKDLFNGEEDPLNIIVPVYGEDNKQEKSLYEFVKDKSGLY